MANRIISFELAADHESVFVYTGESDEDKELQACIGLQREDITYQLGQYAEAAILKELMR